MSRYITVSTKVRKDIKEEAERLGINISGSKKGLRRSKKDRHLL